MPKPVSDLRTTNIPLDVHKYSNIHGLQEQAQKHWGLRRLQPFFPSIEKLFKLDVRLPHQYGIKTTTPIQTITGESSVYTSGKETPVHLKKTMLYSAYRVMHGEYAGTGLPNTEEVAAEPLRIQSPYNAAYVGSLASLILSESECAHFPRVYGVFSGVAERHVLDISDDYEDLCDRPWFSQNIGHFFELRLKKPEVPVLQFADVPTDDIDLGATELEPIATNVPPIIPTTYTDIESAEDAEMEDGDESTDSCSTDYIFKIRSCSDSSSSDDDDDDSDGDDDDEENEVRGSGEFSEPEEEEEFAHAIFKDAPIQVTVMEKCEGTFYKLFKENHEIEKRCAWLAQVIFALAYAQRTFGFVHNDLHLMNVMYVPTDKEYFYYAIGGKTYRVPTYGKLVKIIDFDRATFSVKLPKMKESKFFMSDQFHQEEEAGGQYNISPFYNSKYPEVKPNPSFDLVRLATSMFWDCFPSGPDDSYSYNPIFRMFMSWLTLPDGKSILFRDAENGDFSERYRGFQLYKAIARYCRDTAVPRKQIEKFGTPYLFEGKPPTGESILFIEP
jgi:hypothetical protein